MRYPLSNYGRKLWDKGKAEGKAEGKDEMIDEMLLMGTAMDFIAKASKKPLKYIMQRHQMLNIATTGD